MQTRFIYVIGVTKNPVKIGTAVSPVERLGSLQVGSPETLTLHHAIQTPDWAAKAVEAAAHKHLAERHRRGEWFNVDADEAADVVRQIARQIVDAGRQRFALTQDGMWELVKEQDVELEHVEAIAAYQRLMTHPEPGERARVGHINALIMKAEGAAALTVFRMVIADRKELPSSLKRDAVAYRNAKRALSRALSVVSDYLAFGREEALRKAIDKIQQSAA